MSERASDGWSICPVCGELGKEVQVCADLRVCQGRGHALPTLEVCAGCGRALMGEREAPGQEQTR